MKKKFYMIGISLIIIILFMLIALIYRSAMTRMLVNKIGRYNEIYNSIYKSTELSLEAQYPKEYRESNCSYKEEMKIDSDYLISQGYLNKYDMLDFDNRSYCQGYSIVKQNKDCNFDYKVYIKCNNYQSDGYSDFER